MSLYTHDITAVAVQVITSVGFVVEIDGDDKEKVMYKRNSALWNKKVDMKGQLHRGRNPDKSGEITLKLLKTNTVNDFLNGLILLDKFGGFFGLDVFLRAGADLFTIRILDRLTGKEKCIGRNCFIEEQPEITEEAEISSLSWKICAPELIIPTIGGLFTP